MNPNTPYYHFDGKLYYEIDSEEHTAKVTGSKESLRNIVIPDTIELEGLKYDVVEIGKGAFKNQKMKAVKIGNNIKRIGIRAFAECTDLFNVTLGDTVIQLNCGAFSDCLNLVSINFPSSLESIETHVFSGCIRLNDIVSNITDPDHCKIARYAFGYDDDIYHRVYLHVPDDTACIYKSRAEWEKFTHIIGENCLQYRNHIFREEGDFLIDVYGAYYSLDGTRLISVPKETILYDIICGTKIIGKEAFKASLVERVNIPNTVTAIEDAAFEDCHQLLSIVLPDSIKEIGHSAFYGCNHLKELNLPRYINGIHIHTFRDCRALEKVYIPSGVEYIGLGAFSDCSALTSIVIPTMASIEAFAFSGCRSLTDVSLPSLSKEEQIEYELFEGCESLKKIYYPYNNIHERMFARCVNLEEVIIGGKISFCDDSAFYYCSALRKVEFHCPAHPEMDTFENFYRFSGRKNHEVEFLIPAKYEDSFRSLFTLAEKNSNITITLKP